MTKVKNIFMVITIPASPSSNHNSVTFSELTDCCQALGLNPKQIQNFSCHMSYFCGYFRGEQNPKLQVLG